MKYGIQMIMDMLPYEIKTACKVQPEVMEILTEIHFRVNQPIICNAKNVEYFIDKNYRFVYSRECKVEECFRATKKMIEDFLAIVTKHSLYAYQKQLSEGYLCIQGGNRLGVLGDMAVYKDSGCWFRHISFLALRLSHEVIGCSETLYRELSQSDGEIRGNILLLSPPGKGKTTMLRDMSRKMSDGGRKVVIIDERGELAACYEGIPQLYVGQRTSVLTGCSKEIGMEMAVRSMSPEILVIDELGSENEVKSIMFALHSGCRVLCTMHGKDIQDVKEKGLLDGEGIFHNIVLLKQRDGEFGYVILKKAGEMC